MPIFDLSLGWIIANPSERPEAALAAIELQGALRRLAGCDFPILPAAPAGVLTIQLAHGESRQDGFSWQSFNKSIKIYGDNPRGLLYGVYAFLEQLGAAWVSPGKAGERLPTGTRFELPESARLETPAFPGRCLILGHYAFLKDAREWIIWAARNRINTLFVHIISGPMAFGAAPASQWQAHKDELVPLARERGMTIELGGHGLSDLLPRGLFKQMPEAFRYAHGRRTPDHNLCPSSPQGLAEVRRQAENYFHANPEADVYHLWADDIVGGGWCECPACAGLSPSDQALLATNAVAQALEAVKPGAQVAFLAYHDTENTPTNVEPRANVALLWAPRMRCYAHPTDDPDCLVNSPRYPETFIEQVARFERSAAAPARVFEYYLDGILFKSLLPPLVRVMRADLAFYRRAGTHTIQALMTGDMPWLNAQINAWSFARLAWNPELDPNQVTSDFCRVTFQNESRALPDYFNALDQAFALALEIDPAQIRLELDESVMGMITNPPADMGDPLYAPAAVLHERLAWAAAIPVLLEKAEELLNSARGGSEKAAWHNEWDWFQLARAWLNFDLARLELYHDLALKQPAPQLRRHLDEARAALNEVLAWGEAHIADPRLRLNFRFLHIAFWQLRLEAIETEQLTPPLLRLPRRIRVLVQAVLGQRKLMRIYEA